MNAPIKEYLEVVDKVYSSDKPNHLGEKILLESSLNIDKWVEKLQYYYDKDLVSLLAYGFPLGVNRDKRDALKRAEVNNHSTARVYPDDVQAYIDKELQEGALLGPFHEIPHEMYHCSPLLTRHKEGDTRRLLVDLSYGGNKPSTSTQTSTLMRAWILP